MKAQTQNYIAAAVPRDMGLPPCHILPFRIRCGLILSGRVSPKSTSTVKVSTRPDAEKEAPMFYRFLEASPALLAAYLSGHVAAALLRSYVTGSHC